MTAAYKIVDHSYDVVVVGAGKAAARMAHTAYATRESLGRGQVVLFADNPAYRRWMKETERMLINAILLGPGLGTRWSTPW